VEGALATSDTESLVDEYYDQFAEHLAAEAGPLIQWMLSRIVREVPELAGPDPRLNELAARVLAANLENIRAAIRCRASLQHPFVPPSNMEYARLLAQRGVEADRLLLGYELSKRLLARAFVEHAGAVVSDHDDLVLIAQGVLAYAFAYTDAATQAALASHAATQDKWLQGQTAELAQRLTAVLEGAVRDADEAERMLGYPVSGRHVAVKLWFDDAPIKRQQLERLRSQLRALPGARDVLMVLRDERTLACWVLASESPPVDDWVEIIRKARPASRVAFGEPGTGQDGFRLSREQALAAGGVLARARNDVSRVVRYSEVAAIAFLVDKLPESDAWVKSTLGQLAADDEECDRLRNTVLVYLEEGENAGAAGRRLFLHRNSVRYRVDQARKMLPVRLEDRRLDILLALKYCKWIPVSNGQDYWVPDTKINAELTIPAHRKTALECAG